MYHKILLGMAIALIALTACTSATPPTQAPAEPSAIPAPVGSAAPAEAGTEAEPMTFTDDFGRTIELKGHPKAIVSLSPSTTEILFAIGAGERVAGRDDVSLYPEEALEVTSVGSLWSELPTEAILALEPDLVLVAQIISEEQVQALADLGLQVYWQANPADYQGLFDNLTDIANLTGNQAQAEALVAELSTRVEAVRDALDGVGTTPSVFYELDATDPTNPWTAGTGTFIDYIINSAGGVNAAADLQGDYVQISTEGLIAADPSFILLGDALYGITLESVAERPGWQVISAVKDGAIYPIDPNLMSVPGPRLVDALEETARILHPELFE